MLRMSIFAFPCETIYCICWVNTGTYEAAPVFRTVIVDRVEVISRNEVHYIGDDGVIYTNKTRMFKDKEHAQAVYQELLKERTNEN